MAIPARITAQDTLNTSGTNTVTTAYATTPTTGNLLVAVVNLVGTASLVTAATVSDSNGNWTQIANVQPAVGHEVGIYYQIAAASQPTAITATGTVVVTVSAHLAIHEYSGIVNASPVDTSNTASNASATTSPGASITTAAPNAFDLIFSAAGEVGNNGGGLSVDSSFNLITSGARIIDADRIPLAIGTYNPKFTWTTARQVGQVTVAFKARRSGELALLGVG